MVKIAKTKFKPDNIFTDIKYNNECTAVLKAFSVLKNRVEQSVWEEKPNGLPSLVLCRADRFNPVCFFCESKFGFALTTVAFGNRADSILPLFYKVSKPKEISVPKYIFLLRPEVDGDIKPTTAIYYDKNSKKGREPLSVGVLKSDANPFKYYVFYPKIGQNGFIEKLNVLTNLQKEIKDLELKNAIQLHNEIIHCLTTITQKKSEIQKLAKSITDLIQESIIEEDIFWDQSFSDENAAKMLEFLQDAYTVDAIRENNPDEANRMTKIFDQLGEFQKCRQDVASNRTQAKKKLDKEFEKLGESIKLLTERVERSENPELDVDDPVWKYGPQTEKIWDVMNEIIAVRTTMLGFSNNYKGDIKLKLMHVIQFVYDREEELFDAVGDSGSTLSGTSQVLLKSQ